MVSMKDIAKSCGVSVATVSKALNNHSDIGEKTKQKIKETAQELGYFPNSIARALKTNRTYNLGVLFVDEANSGLTHEYFSAVLEGFKVRSEQMGYDITFINTNIGQNKMTYLEHCKYRNMDGVVIACVDFSNPDVTELVESDIPIVTIDYSFNNCTSVVSDNVGGIQSLMEYVIHKGHRRIAYIHGQNNSMVTKDRLASFYRTAEQYQIEIPEEYVKEAAYLDPKIVAKETEELLALTEPPTCILYPDDTAMIGGINVIRSHGLKIPEDISVAGYDGHRIATLMDPKLTTVKQDTESIGKEAAEKLIHAIESPKTALIERKVIPGKLIAGESVAEIKY